MSSEKSVSFSGKAGDVSSMNEVSRSLESTVDRPPAESLLNERRKANQDGISAYKEVKTLVSEMRKTPAARKILMLVGAAFAVLSINVYGEILMNKWQGAFFRAIEHRNVPEVGKQAAVFVSLMLVLLCFIVLQNWLLERFKIRFREWLTKHFLNFWMLPAHAYRLNMTTEEQLNPDQRIQEDVRNFSEMCGDLGLGAARAVLMLVCFVGVLWNMSSGITLPLFNHDVMIPGYMVWFALIYAAIGTFAAAKVGAPLIALNEERYTREANFRYSLVRISDNAESISLYSGEKDERKIAESNLSRVLATLKTISFANARLTWIATGHGWMVVLLPVLVALPGFLQGKLDFGGLMMVIGAFNQVQLSLRWVVENYPRIADWRTTLHRVVAFHDAITMVDDLENPETIQLEPHPDKLLEFDKTSVSLMDGKVVIADATARINLGERVLLVGESGSGKSTLLRAVGGLWPWGSGRILLPPKDEMLFLPQKPYIPLGTLKNALAYPNTSKTWDQKDMEECLRRVNLEAFIPMLEQTDRWDKLMSLGQQQRLAFARLLLHRPKWIFLDEATSALDEVNQHRVMSLLIDDLSESAVVSIGHRAGLDQYHTRTLHLTQTKEGQVLMKKPTPERKITRRRRTKVFEKLGVAVRNVAVTQQTT